MNRISIPCSKSELTGAASGPVLRFWATAVRRDVPVRRVASWFAWGHRGSVEQVPKSMAGKADGRGRTVSLTVRHCPERQTTPRKSTTADQVAPVRRLQREG